jgi:hypothetical protein
MSSFWKALAAMLALVACPCGLECPVLAGNVDLTVVYEAASGQEPSAIPALGFVSSGLGQADFPAAASPRLRTVDDSALADGRYYFRAFTPRELDSACSLRCEVRLRVLAAAGSPAAVCVQASLQDRRFGLGFLLHEAGPDDDEVLFMDFGGSGAGEIIARRCLAADTMRSYSFQVERGKPGPDDDCLYLTIEGDPGAPLTVRIADLTPCASLNYYGLLFGHPVGAGTGEAEWERIAMTIAREQAPQGPLSIGTRRQLFLDDWLLESTARLQRVQGEATKSPLNPVLRREYPWEAARCELYGSAVWDPAGRRLQLFYSAMSRPYEILMAYAESTDRGLHWRKPLLALVEFAGQKTNVVYPGRYSPHGPSVFRDEHDPDPARRYKLFTADFPVPVTAEAQTRGPAGIDVAFSPDGIQWTPSARNPVLPGFISDTGQCAFWDADRGRYVAFVRMYIGGQRSVARTESSDFETWSSPVAVYLPSPADRERNWQFYSLSVTPYQGLYVGLVWIFPALPASADWQADTPTTWPELVVSRDGFAWERPFFGAPFLAPGEPGSFDRRQIRTASSLVVLDDAILLLYAGSPHPHVAAHTYDIGLATLRLDGFAALAAGAEEGTLLTRPLHFAPGPLHVNAQTGPGGSVRAEVCDAQGTPLPGYEAARCTPCSGDATAAGLSWGLHATVPEASGAGLRLRFVLTNAKLWSFWIGAGG